MKNLKCIFYSVILISIVSCSKDNSNSEQFPKETSLTEPCQTIDSMTWTQTVTADSLVGNWIIWRISSSKGIGQINIFETTYNIVAPLILNPNGTGSIYSKPLYWSLTTSPNSLPKLKITQLDTLFQFPVNFIYNDTSDTYMQNIPKKSAPTRFFVSAGKSTNGQWEQTYISFERQ